ncbi:MAG: NAD-dependent epimerase/dehydratase family protein [Paracoccaceae bacterium]
MTEQILLTGITGFIAKHVALKLLGAGYSVRGTVRRLDRTEEVRAALRPHLKAEALERLTFAACDLESDMGWDDAMGGITTLVHTASPFPIALPKDEMTLIRPARDGTLRVMKVAHAAGVKRIVLTSSTAAVQNGRQGVLSEDDWCDPAVAGVSAYAKSKVLAERAAWQFAISAAQALTVINPGFVLGPPLDGNFGSSIGVVKRILAGRDPMLPLIGFVCVDVRDVAEMHLRAVQRPETAGKRYMAAAGSLTMPQMGAILKAAYPARRIPTWTAPKFALQVLALFDAQIRAILPSVGQLVEASNARAVAEMGMEFIAPDAALLASAEWLVRNGGV